MMKSNQLRIIQVFTIIIVLLNLTDSTSCYAQPSEDGRQTLPSYNISGFIQQHFVVDESPDVPPRFSIYRARVGVTGRVSERINVNLIGGYIEPPDGTPRLVNAFVDFNLHSFFSVRTGQFLVPFGLEGPEVIIFNPAIERTTVIRRLNTFALFRDVGVQISGRRSGFHYAIAVVNGAGANRIEQIDPKDIIGRIGFDFTEHINLGISGHIGHHQPDPASTNHESRYRFGADIRYTGAPFFFRGEFIYRKDDFFDALYQRMYGAYFLAGYKFTSNLEAITRIEFLEPDSNFDDNELTVFTIGANYRFIGNTRLSVNYEIRDDKLNPDLKNLFTLQMQVAL